MKRLSSFLAGALTITLVAGLSVTALAATGRLTITVDPINIQVNGATFQPKDAHGNAVPVFAYNGTTYAPLRALAEAYGLTVGYDAGQNMATVSGGSGAAVPPASVATPAPTTPNLQNAKPKSIHIELVKLDGKFYDFSETTGNHAIASYLMPTGEVAGVPNMVFTAYIISILNGDYKINSTNVQNPNLAGTIDAFKDLETKTLYYTGSQTYEYSGLNEINVYTDTLHVGTSFSATIVNSTSDGLRTAIPQDIAIPIQSGKEGYNEYAINLSLICKNLGINAPNVYFDKNFNAYILNLD